MSYSPLVVNPGQGLILLVSPVFPELFHPGNNHLKLVYKADIDSAHVRRLDHLHSHICYITSTTTHTFSLPHFSFALTNPFFFKRWITVRTVDSLIEVRSASCLHVPAPLSS